MEDSSFPVLWRDKTPAAEYEAAVRSRIFNGKQPPSSSPVAIVRPTTVAHVVAAAQLANSLDVRIAVRSGGHSASCWSLQCEDSVLIDLVNFRHMAYDAQTQMVTVSPAVTSAELLRFLKDKDRFFPAGHSGDVGLGGFLLQGGLGLNSRVCYILRVCVESDQLADDETFFR
jgi:FAD/FMN-containing dehydrogenase